MRMDRGMNSFHVGLGKEGDSWELDLKNALHQWELGFLKMAGF